MSHTQLLNLTHTTFVVETLATASSYEELNRLEAWFISHLVTAVSGYNIRLGGHNTPNSPETRFRMALAARSLPASVQNQRALTHLRRGGAVGYRLVSPTGKVFETTNLRSFCRVRGLQPRSLRKALDFTGKSAHKGWLGARILYGDKMSAASKRRWAKGIMAQYRLHHSIEVQTHKQISTRLAHKGFAGYRLISPSGRIYEAKNLSAICRRFRLEVSSICKVITGSLKHLRGWFAERIRANQYPTERDNEGEKGRRLSAPAADGGRVAIERRIAASLASRGYAGYIFISPSGKTYKVLNLARFCKRMRLDLSAALKAAKNGGVYRGWSARLSQIQPGSKTEVVRCMETGEDFHTFSEAAKRVHRTFRALRVATITGSKCGGFHWKVVETTFQPESKIILT